MKLFQELSGAIMGCEYEGGAWVEYLNKNYYRRNTNFGAKINLYWGRMVKDLMGSLVLLWADASRQFGLFLFTTQIQNEKSCLSLKLNGERWTGMVCCVCGCEKLSK